MKKVIYTTIFNNYDNIIEPSFISNGWDFICFTDTDIKSNVWDVRKVLPLYEDPARNAKKYKILPHRYLSEYDISIFIDGNMLIRGDVNELIYDYLVNSNLSMFDHNQCYDKKNCIYKEAEAIKWLYEINQSPNKVPKDNLDIIQNQINKYNEAGFPQNIGLISGGVILRRHNEKDCIQAMEDWWTEIKYNSKRDQLSFNYVAWKNNFKFKYMEGDIRDNTYFYLLPHNHQK